MMDTIADVRAALDPTLTRLGFAPGQDPGYPLDDSGDIIFCASATSFSRAFPWLPQSTPQDGLDGHGCVDLTVSLTLGRIVEVDLEGVALVETLMLLGRAEDAAEAASLLHTPAGLASVRLGAVLSRLFEGPGRRIGPGTET